MKQLLFLLAFTLSIHAFGQNISVNGVLVDTAQQPVKFATVALLNPVDSTLQFYAISNTAGAFTVKNVKADTFLLQVAGLEYQTYYRTLVVAGNVNLGSIALKSKSHLLDEVSITSEKVPLLIKGDTIEYNSSAYKTKPDAVAEDLLRKLPGVEVDRAGNVKAQGKQVSKVLVDGKEFFGNDPKIATKNLPADAVDKVQVFDKKSDASLFTGIDDGQRDKTINLQLKKDKKSGYFGSVQAGYGIDERYKLNAKVYKFRQKSQLAVLGMVNNINEFGFTMDDYLNFQGGLRSLMDGNGNVQFRFNANDNLPVNFGQTVTGLIQSGAGGINYTYEPAKDQRFNISYLGSGVGKQLNEDVYSKNFSSSGNFERKENSDEYSENWAHRINISARSNLDSSLMVSLNGGVTLQNNNLDNKLHSSTFIEQAVFNTLNSNSVETENALAANARIGLNKKWKGKFPVFKLGGGVSYRQKLNDLDWLNITNITGGNTVTDGQFQNNDTRNIVYDGNTCIVRDLGKGFFLETQISGGWDSETLKRRQGLKLAESKAIDSLSPDFARVNSYVKPGISIQQSKKDRQMRFGLQYQAGGLVSGIKGRANNIYNYGYLLPSLMYRKELANSTNIQFDYNASVNSPTAGQMLPVTNTSNPLMLFTGNNQLRPEIEHRANIQFLRFDQFNFSSFFANISATFTSDKINWKRAIQPDLTQRLTFVNVPEDYVADGRVEYSTPVRKLGITCTASFSERFQKGINIVNDVDNYTTTFRHEFEMKVGNRKKEKWDVQAGGYVSFTDAKYSVQQELDNYFTTINYFAEINYRPKDKWFFNIVADINQYASKSFSSNVTVPLLKAELSYFFLKANKGCISLNAFDILNSNTGLQRISELNYLLERRSNIIGQYFMLSFKYRLNRSGDSGANVITIGR